MDPINATRPDNCAVKDPERHRSCECEIAIVPQLYIIIHHPYLTRNVWDFNHPKLEVYCYRFYHIKLKA